MGEVVTDISSMKEIIRLVTLGIPKKIKKIQFLFLLLLTLTFRSEMKI